jgi:hypothetical protein
VAQLVNLRNLDQRKPRDLVRSTNKISVQYSPQMWTINQRVRQRCIR